MSSITVQPIVNTRRIEPDTSGRTVRRYPVDFRLNFLQQIGCACIGSMGGVLLGRPINQLQHFYFLTITPDKMSVPQKNAKFWSTIKSVRWFSGPTPLLVEVGGFAGLYTTYYMVDEALVPHKGIPSVLRGAVCGAVTGFTVAAVRHPYDVLRATANQPGPKKFTGAFDVLITTIKNKPAALAGIYKGFPIAAIASMAQFGVLFGVWEVVKYGAVTGLDTTLFAAAFLAVVLGHAAQYPLHYVKQAAHDLNKTKRFGGLTGTQYVKEMRRTRGVTVVFTGFFKTKPLIGSVGATLTLMGYDYMKRFLHDQINPNAPRAT